MTGSFLRTILIAPVLVATAAAASAETPTFSRDTVTGAAHPRAIAAADFNHDGRVDVATGGTGTGTVDIFLNTGSGGLRFSKEIVVGGGPFDMAAADLNRDGWADLAIANADLDAVTILVNSSGTFLPKRDIAVTGNPRGIAVADATGDGIPDILVTQYAANTWTLLTGDGTGGVSGRATFATATRPQGIAAADLDHDGRMDAVIANGGTASVTTFYAAGTGTPTRRDTVTPTTNNVLTTANVNGDGWLDVIAASSDSSRAVVLRGSATGLVRGATLTTGASPRGITVGDFNQDGAVDIAIASRNSSVVTVHPGRGDGTFADAVTLPAGGGSRAVVAADVDRNGRIDLIAANETDSTATLFLNTTVLTEAAHVFSIRDYGTVGNGTEMEGRIPVATGDFDHDGRTDFAISGGQSGTRVTLASGGQVDVGAAFPWQVAAADVNRDGHLDLIASFNALDRVDVMLGDGRGSFAAPQSIAVALPLDFAVGDFTRDGRADIVVVARNPSAPGAALRLFAGRGDGRFDASTIAPLPYEVVTIASGDIDADGRLDLVASLGYPSAPELRVFFGDGVKGWARTQSIPLGRTAGTLKIATMTGGGCPDIVAGSDEALVIVSNSSGRFAAPQSVPVEQGRYASWIGVGDLNGDGQLDIITSGTDVYFGHGDGTFDRKDFAPTGSGPLIEDVTGDGVADVVLAEFRAVRVLVGERNENNRPPTVTAFGETIGYGFIDDGAMVWAEGIDPDAHELTYEWHDSHGAVVGTGSGLSIAGDQPPGSYTYTVTAFDGRGGSATATATVTIAPYKEINMWVSELASTAGAWVAVADSTAAGGVRLQHPDAGAAKLADPRPNPTNYFEIAFRADPTQTYKLWLRGKAERNSGLNDSVFVQFSGATDTSGNARWQIGSSDALAINLEECSGCGLSGWGWEDDGWGAVNRNGTLLRFPEGGWQRIRVQTREDGLGVDQIVLSAEKYRTTRPGAAKNDATIVPNTVLYED